MASVGARCIGSEPNDSHDRVNPPIEIQIADLYRAFGDKHVLCGIDLTIYAGDTLAIVGDSGCGKTVLLEHILGKLLPDRGRIAVVDHDDPDQPLRDLASFGPLEIERIHQHWGVVFQRNALFSGTVYDNIALWLRDVAGLGEPAIRDHARGVLEVVGLRADDAFLATDQHALSGGMAKRLAIARALAMEPIVLFYDEPTTGLDPINSARMQDLIFATHNAVMPSGVERTTVIVTHDKDLLTRLRPRTVLLHAGRVYFDGPFSDFEQSHSDIIRPYFELMPILNQRPAAG